MSNHLTDAQYAAFIDRLIACRQAEDDAKEDTKLVYAELADAGEDKTAAGLIVRGLRMSAKDRAKANLRDAAVENGMDRYNRGKASHVRAREASIPEHDADGVITETEVAAAAAAGGSPAYHRPTTVSKPGGQNVAPPPAHAPEQPGTDHGSVNVPAEGSADSAAIRRMSMTPLEPREAGGLKGFGFTVRFDEPAPLTQGVAAVGGGSANHPVASAAVTIADQSKPNPICRDPGDCGVYASWAMPCQACKAAAAHRSAA